MVIIIVKKAVITFLILSLFILSGVYFYVLSFASETAFIELDEDLQKILNSEIQNIFIHRNNALLGANSDSLEKLYNTEIRNGLWAYEHELKKMKYLHQWSDKQGIEFTNIDSDTIIRYVKEKGEGLSLNVLVSTEYTYVYEDSKTNFNTFRIGAYYSIDIIQRFDSWMINREWYTDPFADSLHLDEIKSQELQELILSKQSKDLKDLNDRRIKAVEYADEYCGAASLPEYGYKYNPNYRDYNNSGGDCANFASQILYEGGQFSKNYTWNYERGAGSKTWLNASSFNSYMLNSGRASTIARGSYENVLEPSYKLLPGDYIAYEKNGKVTHISVVTGIDSKGYALVNSHNTDRYRVPWDLGWSNKSIRFILVRVHY